MSRFHPNTVSGFATVCAFAAGALFYVAPREDRAYLLVPLFLFLRIAFNALDGMVAQRRGLASRSGEMVNEFSDRVNDVIILVGLALSGATTPAWVWAALVGVLLVSYVGILPRAAGGSRRYDGPLGKADRMLLLGVASVAAFVAPRIAWPALWGDLDAAGTVFVFTMWLFVALALVTVLNRWRRAWRELEAQA